MFASSALPTASLTAYTSERRHLEPAHRTDHRTPAKPSSDAPLLVWPSTRHIDARSSAPRQSPKEPNVEPTTQSLLIDEFIYCREP
jgi:hypothetical protein